MRMDRQCPVALGAFGIVITSAARDLLFVAAERKQRPCDRSREVKQQKSSREFPMIHQDIRYGLRQLRKSPGFATVAVLTLALGIGANTAMFSVVDTILLRPLPYLEPDHLVLVSETVMASSADYVGVAAQEYSDYRNQNLSFSNVAAFESA